MKTTNILLIVGGVAVGAGLLYLFTRKKEEAIRLAEPVPESPKTPEEEALSKAMGEMRLSREDIVVRNLLPSDFGLTTFSFNVNPGWNTIISNSVPDQTYILLKGLFYTGTNVTQVKISIGAAAREVWSISGIAAMENKVYRDMTPSLASQNQLIRIEVYAQNAGTENINFDGQVFEKRGITVA